MERRLGMVTILLATDDQVMGGLLKEKINSQSDMRVIYETHRINMILKTVCDKSPDLLLIDLDLSIDDMIQLIQEVVSHHQKLKIILLAEHRNKEYIIRAFRAGASGIVIKNPERCQIVDVIRSVHYSETYLFPNYLETTHYETTRLTEREEEVLSLVAAGYTNKEVADRLALSVKTVESHRANIMRKLNITKRAELVQYAVKHGYFDYVGMS